MKKVCVILLIILLGCSGFYLYKNFNKEENKEEKSETKKEDVIESDDLFGEYYTKANKYMKNMTLAEKVGQMFLVQYDKNVSIKEITNFNAGGFLLFAKDVQNHTKDSLKKELKEKQSLSKTPLIFAVDEEGGYVTRVSRFTQFRNEKFKSNRTLFETGGYELVEKSEKEKAKLLLDLGFNLNLAPVADVSTNSDDFMYIRTFGRDANATAEFISNIVSYNNEAKISSSLKHFPGYGNNADTHGDIAIDERSYETFVNSDYIPFKSGIEAKVPTILVSHNIVKAIDSEYPASLSSKVVSELRDKLNFSGVIITDDLAMGAVSKYVKDGSAATLAVNAGVDIMITANYEEMYTEVLNNVKSGIIKEETIDKAVMRIIAWKYAYGIM